MWWSCGRVRPVRCGLRGPRACRRDIGPLTGEQLLVGSSLDPRWTTSADAPLSAAPAFDAAAAYAPFVSGEVVALDLDSGAVLWRAPVATTRSPTSGGGLVFVVAPTGLQALSAKTGAVVWERALPGAIAGPVYWDTGWLIVSFEGGDLAALRASDGELLWRRPLGAVVRVPPAPGLANLYLGMADGRLLAVELASGRPVWNSPARRACKRAGRRRRRTGRRHVWAVSARPRVAHGPPTLAVACGCRRPGLGRRRQPSPLRGRLRPRPPCARSTLG